MRRLTTSEMPPDPCGCDTDAARYQCSREREHALIRAVELAELNEAADSVCARPAPTAAPGAPSQPATASSGDGPDPRCGCLTACPEACCATRSWVLLGCVDIRPASDDLKGIGEADIDLSRRKYVKPIECACGPAARGELEALKDRVKNLESAST